VYSLSETRYRVRTSLSRSGARSLLRAESWTVGTASAASARSLVRHARAADEERASGDGR